nr:GntR family transcriptional regulator [Streptomyces sp. NBC_00886]
MENALREQLESGVFQLNQSLPPQRALAQEYAVSRDTIQKVLRKLTEEGWLEPRQGSGVRVVKVPQVRLTEARPGSRGRVSLGSLVNRAFERAEVTLDAASLTSETLLRHLRVQEERLAAKEIDPRTLHIRMLLPGEEERLAYPAAEDPDDARIWERWRGMVQDHCAELDELAVRLRDLGVDTRIEVVRVPMTPQFKLYVLNGTDMLFGPYAPFRRPITLKDVGGSRESRTVASVDVLGAGSTLSYHRMEEDEETHDSVFFTSMRDWFRSNWEYWEYRAELQLRSEGASDKTP